MKPYLVSEQHIGFLRRWIEKKELIELFTYVFLMYEDILKVSQGAKANDLNRSGTIEETVWQSLGIIDNKPESEMHCLIKKCVHFSFRIIDVETHLNEANLWTKKDRWRDM